MNFNCTWKTRNVLVRISPMKSVPELKYDTATPKKR